MDLREIEGFLAVADELHFGRAATRLRVSQGRVSQLVRSLETHVGARLFDRSSRRVVLTPIGERFRAGLVPAYGALTGAVESARAEARGIAGVLRIGFLGGLSERLTGAIGRFEARHPDCEIRLTEVVPADPFGAVRSGELDTTVVLNPVAEPDLVTTRPFSRAPFVLVVSNRHPLARKKIVGPEDLAGHPVIGMADPAPEYWWRYPWPEAAPTGPRVRTYPEALAAVAAGRGAMLQCAPTAALHPRSDVTVVPTRELPESSLTLIWRRDAETVRLKAFAEAVSR
ncbi:LysR family transcriptional regulator [Actinorhabdospora filicis]|uniref:LysR family transcriptional regulator n=1 Tax=Actinorhabdospora filicis TaxID=1785913 RepID=A0A9W6W6G0_9ACTN|nr:LysR family transcriptional regulator [Actinorhabdospora filicis]GLZ81502.1 LysR family transcriptional regulator [Actinorhabdospora filicis]